MSQSKENSDLIKLLGTAGDAGGRILGGLMSSPWTGIPLTIMILSQLDTSGNLTIQFAKNLSTWLGAVGKELANALANLGTGVLKTGGSLLDDFLRDTPFGSTSPPPPPPPPPPSEEIIITERVYYTVEVFPGVLGGPYTIRYHDTKAAAEQDFTITQVAVIFFAVRPIVLSEQRERFQNGVSIGVVGTPLKKWP